jgi:hypothetical protein
MVFPCLPSISEPKYCKHSHSMPIWSPWPGSPITVQWEARTHYVTPPFAIICNLPSLCRAMAGADAGSWLQGSPCGICDGKVAWTGLSRSTAGWPCQKSFHDCSKLINSRTHHHYLTLANDNFVKLLKPSGKFTCIMWSSHCTDMFRMDLRTNSNFYLIQL